MGGPADKAPPSITLVLREGTTWRMLYHDPKNGPLDLGDVTILNHTRKGLECHLFGPRLTRVLPYPADDNWRLDHRNHVRVGDGKGEVRMTFAPNEPE